MSEDDEDMFGALDGEAVDDPSPNSMSSTPLDISGVVGQPTIPAVMSSAAKTSRGGFAMDDLGSDFDTSISLPSDLELDSSSGSESGEEAEDEESEQSEDAGSGTEESEDAGSAGSARNTSESENSGSDESTLDASDISSDESSDSSDELSDGEVAGLSDHSPALESSEILDSSFQDSAGPSTSQLPPCSLDTARPEKKRRARGKFKRGFLKREKRHISRASNTSTDAEQSEAYDDLLKGVVGSEVEVTEGDDSAISTGYVSTLPNSDGELADDLEEKAKVKTRVPRKKRGIGRKSKFTWKKNTPAVPAYNETCLSDSSKEKPVLPSVQPSGTKSLNVAPTPCSDQMNKIDVGTSIDREEMLEISMASLPVLTENYSLISEYLRFTLSDTWTVSVFKNSVIISAIVQPENPSVERAISWSVEGMSIFVRGMRVKQNHPIWQIKQPDFSNCGEVADYLSKVANYFERLKICTGITHYESLWKNCTVGVVQRNFETPCLRHLDCSLLLGTMKTCVSCSHLKKVLGNKNSRARKRTAHARGSISSKTNERYLENEDLIQKLDQLKKDDKLNKQRVKRLQVRIQKLIKERAERVDAELSKDFAQIMNHNKDKMSALQLIFWEQQSKALSLSNSKSMKWHPAMIRLALHIRMLSPSAYDALRGVLILPSQRRLFDYSQYVDVKEGLQQELLEKFRQLLLKDCPEDYQKWFSALLDEMSIRSCLVYSSRTGELIGYTDLSSLEEALKELEDKMKGLPSEKRLAKKVLVFMLTGIANDIRFVAAIFSTDDLSAAQLYSRAWEVIYAVEETGAKVLLVIFDGASVNRKFLSMNFNAGETSFTYVTKNSASGDSRPLFFIVDPPHLLKTFRNCLANSYAHRKSRCLWKNQQDISWKAIEALFEITKGEKFKSTKLTKAHIILTSFSCMKVALAVQLFSGSVGRALLRNKDHPLLKSAFAQELVDFILIMNRTFDCLNGGTSSKKMDINTDLKEYTSVDDIRFEFLEREVLKFMEDWENDVANRQGNYSKEDRSRMMISYQSMEALKITIHSFIHATKFLIKAGVPAVSSRKFNQDPLEQYFSDLRRAAGSNDNPDLKQVLHNRLAIQVQGPTFLSGGRGNTEVLKRKFETVDESPLLVRKKNKK